ncbi:hypothetical protein [Clostridium sp.]|jgi:hypothetical protein|uniref:hypothetical protein n=1 Tax=Clostridium sp. TaxID=1506 RepID=UPI0025C333A0|nr:hypothetical protein [Clostridium sp.]MCI9070226.1 hypothetical protein [Clostridium sp.]
MINLGNLFDSIKSLGSTLFKPRKKNAEKSTLKAKAVFEDVEIIGDNNLKISAKKMNIVYYEKHSTNNLQD